VRHITATRLGDLQPLLVQMRELDGLVERTPGVFYRRSRAFLHFHEHGDDIYADVRLSGDEFDRVKVTTASEQRRFVTRVRAWHDAQR
jgi:hypothetical protein